MKKILIYGIIIGVGILFHLTNFVFAQGELAPVATPTETCPACSTGSPQIQSYISWMRELISAINTTTNKDPGAIIGQLTNIIRKNTESNQRASSIKDKSLTITKQSAGVKSDMRLLNKLYDDLASLGNNLINTKSQRNKAIEPKVLQNINIIIARQTGSDKLLLGSQQLPSTTTYKQLLTSLIDLHSQVAGLTAGMSGTTIYWQGYQGNPTVILKTTTYYSCAKSIPVCRKETTIINDTAASIRGYWGDILRSWGQIQKTLSKQYWTSKTMKQNKEDDNEKSFLGGRVLFGGDWTQYFGGIKAKREAKEAQIKAQSEQVESINNTKGAITQQGTTSISQTSTQFRTTTNDPSYKQQEGFLLIAALNKANDESLSDTIELQKYTILSDSRPVTYKIPAITKAIYESSVVIAESANTVKSVCESHCSNIDNGSCGSDIQSS